MLLAATFDPSGASRQLPFRRGAIGLRESYAAAYIHRLVVGAGVPALPLAGTARNTGEDGWFPQRPSRTYLVGRTVPGAPLRCHSQRRWVVADTSDTHPPVGGGVLDAPSVATCDGAGWLLKRATTTQP